MTTLGGLAFGMAHWFNHRVIRQIEQWSLPSDPTHILVMLTESVVFATDPSRPETRAESTTKPLGTRHREATECVLGCLSYFCNVETEPRTESGLTLADSETKKVTLHKLRVPARCNLKNYHGDTLELASNWATQCGIIPLATFLSFRGAVALPPWLPQTPSSLDQLQSRRMRFGLAFISLQSLLLSSDSMHEILAVHKLIAEEVPRSTGEPGSEAFLQAQASLLKDVPLDAWEAIRHTMRFVKGAREFIRVLQRLGLKTVLLSEGFGPEASLVQRELSMDQYFANVLTVDAKKACFTGEIDNNVPIMDTTRARDLILHLCEVHQVEKSRVLLVGSSHHYGLLLREAGMGVAYNADSGLKSSASAVTDCGIIWDCEDIRDVLHLFGFSQAELKTLSG